VVVLSQGGQNYQVQEEAAPDRKVKGEEFPNCSQDSALQQKNWDNPIPEAKEGQRR